MSATFTPSTVEQILAEIRSIANATDFGAFLAKRRTEYVAMTKQTRHIWQYNDPERFFPSDPDSSMLDALLDKICDLAPVTLPQERLSHHFEHPWLACIRECADKSDCFSNKENPRYADVSRRFVDVLITCFEYVESKTSKNGSSIFILVQATLSRALSAEPRFICCVSDTLIDFLIKGAGDDKSQEFLIRAIFHSAAAGKWIAQAVEKSPTDDILYKMNCAIRKSDSAPLSFSDPEQLRLCFRALHVVKSKKCCNKLGCALDAVFSHIKSVSSSFLNAPLNLPDQNGNIIEDTPLSIACNRTRYCAKWTSKVSCQRLIDLGANVNGLIADPTNPKKKIVSRRDGKTPLMLACVSGDGETVKLFLKNKDLNLSLKDNEGNSGVNYLLRRFDCRERFLKLLHKRDPALFESHVSIADLDFAIRNGLEAPVKFLFSLKKVHFNTTDLQELTSFCFAELLAVESQETTKEDPFKNRCETKKLEEADEDACEEEYDGDICCKSCGYDGPDPNGPSYRQARKSKKALYEPFLNICIRALFMRLHESGCDSIGVSCVGRRDRTRSANGNKNEMKRPKLRAGSDDSNDDSDDDSNDEASIEVDSNARDSNEGDDNEGGANEFDSYVDSNEGSDHESDFDDE